MYTLLAQGQKQISQALTQLSEIRRKPGYSFGPAVVKRSDSDPPSHTEQVKMRREQHLRRQALKRRKMRNGEYKPDDVHVLQDLHEVMNAVIKTRTPSALIMKPPSNSGNSRQNKVGDSHATRGGNGEHLGPGAYDPVLSHTSRMKRTPQYRYVQHSKSGRNTHKQVETKVGPGIYKIREKYTKKRLVGGADWKRAEENRTRPRERRKAHKKPRDKVCDSLSLSLSLFLLSLSLAL